MSNVAQRVAAQIDHRRQARKISLRALERASGWNKQSLVIALRGGAVSIAALDGMAAVVGLRVTVEPTDDLLPLSLDQLRETTR